MKIDNRKLIREEGVSVDLSKIPLGSWDSYGNWFHNPNLKMTYEGQFEHNLAAGHFDSSLKGQQVKPTCGFTVE